MNITTTLRRALRDSGKTAYRIGQDTGGEISVRSLQRFATGEQASLSIDNAELLAAYFGLELTPKRKAKR